MTPSEIPAKSLGRITRVFVVEDKYIADNMSIQKMEELIVLLDTEMDELLSSNEMMTLSVFLLKGGAVLVLPKSKMAFG